MNLLTICIVTFNRAAFLEVLLSSILVNFNILETSSVEVDILVSDNASTDTTPDIVERYMKLLPLTYNRNETNLGFDGNLMVATRMATGKYIWLMGDDDALIDGSLKYLVRFLELHSEVKYAYFPRICTDINLKPLTGIPEPHVMGQDLIFDEGCGMFESVDGQMPTIIFFISSTIIEKYIWLSALEKYSRDPIFGWSHAKPILEAIFNNRSAILGQPGVLARLENARDGSSALWLDSVLAVMISAKRLGFNRNCCDQAMEKAVRGQAKTFVLDKILGRREDSLPSMLSALGIAHLVRGQCFWTQLSRLPYPVLRCFFPLYRLRNWLRNLIIPSNEKNTQSA